MKRQSGIDDAYVSQHWRDQPRDPKGTDTGGQWTSGGGAVENKMKKYNDGKPYYRYTQSENNPMSDWGHAMFADDKERVNGTLYGGHAWEFDANAYANNVADINDLKEKTKIAWQATLKKYEDNAYYYGVNGEDLTDFIEQGMNFDDVFSYLDPKNIVTTAEGYDGDLGIWFYAAVLEPNDILAVVTNDGAIVYDKELINRVPQYDFYGGLD
jgi:hypothetical protein